MTRRKTKKMMRESHNRVHHNLDHINENAYNYRTSRVRGRFAYCYGFNAWSEGLTDLPAETAPAKNKEYNHSELSKPSHLWCDVVHASDSDVRKGNAK